MKKGIIIVGLLFLFITISLAMGTQKDNFQKLWKEVETYEKNAMPQSASSEVDKILKQAISQKNYEQIIKALVHKNKYKVERDWDERQSLIKDLDDLLNQTFGVDEKALIHSMLAELYMGYYEKNMWNINERTEIVGYVPENMNEWSANIFISKTIEHIDLSKKEVTALKKSSSNSYKEIIALGKDSPEYFPTLYDFIMNRSIKIAETIEIAKNRYDAQDIGGVNLKAKQLAVPAKDYVNLNIKAEESGRGIAFALYQEYLKDLIDRNQTAAIINLEIEKIGLLNRLSSIFDKNEQFDAYTKLIETYKSDEHTVELIKALASVDNRHRESDVDSFNEKVYNWCQKGIEDYPNYKRIGILKNLIKELTKPYISVKSESVYYPEKSIEISVMFRNAKAIDKAGTFKLYRKDGEKYIEQKKYAIGLTNEKPFINDTLKYDLGKLDFGNYAFVHNLEKPDNKYSEKRIEFIVSNITSYYRCIGKNEYEVFVVDRFSGKPLEGAEVTFTQKYYSKGVRKEQVLNKTLKSNKLGMVLYSQNEDGNDNNFNLVYQITLGKDSYLKKQPLYGYYNEYTHDSGDEKLNITTLTDRSIYRPGQTAYYKIIVLNKKSKPIANKTMKVQLLDTNYDVVTEKTQNSNEFGSIAGEFILPSGKLNGSYTIRIGGEHDTHIRVEEYKRPTFEVVFDTIAQTYTFGEKVKVKGQVKNFSGINIQNAEVKYTINRNEFNFWWRNSSGGDFIENGSTRTNDDGSFEITFVPEAADKKNHFFRSRTYKYSIEASATDMNGETQSGTLDVNVGDKSMVINIDIPEKIEKTDKSKVGIQTHNLQGKEINSSGTYIVSELKEDDSILGKSLEGSFTTGEQTDLMSKVKQLRSGKYRIEIKALDDKRNVVEEKKDFILYSFDDKMPPIKTNSWLIKKNTIWKDGKPAEIICGASDKSVYVLYQIENKSKVFVRQFLEFNNENKTLKIPYKAEYGDNVFVSLTVLRDGTFEHIIVEIKKDAEVIDRKLEVKTEVFRDKLRPGQTETWTLSIKDKNNTSTSAEVLASMYDISLDKISESGSWSLQYPSIYGNSNNPSDFNFNNPNRYNYFRNLYSSNIKTSKIAGLSLDYINWFGYRYALNLSPINYMDLPRASTYDGLVKREKLSESESSLSENQTNTASPLRFTAPVVSGGGEETLNAEEESGGVQAGKVNLKPQIRRNLNETAFFYPQLRTNENGEVLVSFTVPESNTTWRFRTLAHDKNGRSGSLEQLVVTSKELMITPNLPRFVRQGDKTSISTKISNLDDKSISGEVSIELFDPTTEKPLSIVVQNQKQVFNIETKASTSATWEITIPENIELIGCRIVAQSATFSDGEQHVLSVLPNSMLVTESMPMDMNKTETKNFVFDKFANSNSTSLRNYRLTLEYASNPAWFAIQALPTMSNPSNENAINWFASYYVNTLGSSIVRDYPKVSAMIESWKKQGGKKETLVSKLQKDEELKAVLLEETPWVLDAKNETEQMERLSLLFDLNNTSSQTKKAMEKLGELQLGSGGWSWYKGLYASRSITQYILYGYAELVHTAHKEYGQEEKMMQINGLKFIDNEIKKDFEALQKNNDLKKVSYISTSQLEYLFVRSYYRDIPIAQDVRKAERFYTEVATKNWTKLNLYEKSLLSIILKRNGDKETASKIVKSLTEYAKADESMGMYWPNNKANVFVSLSAISTHTFLMKALIENGTSENEVNLMKQWLIKQKQTQTWESTHATIDAVNTLLSTGSNWFANEEKATIKVGGKAINTNKSELGTGYIQKSWEHSEITNNIAKVEITQQYNQPSYGAMYWQYYESLDKITKHDNSQLSIEKLLFKEISSASGKKLVPITNDNPLNVGDKVTIRLTVNTTRDMEFVALKDMRASCFEPAESLSGIKWNRSMLHYQSIKDASTNMYFDILPKGTYVFEYSVYVSRSGEYSNGITTIQCLYAPEFISHTGGTKINVK